MTIIKRTNYIFSFMVGAMIILSCSGDTGQAPEEEEAHHEEETDIAVLTDAQLKTAGVVLGNIENKQISGTVKVNGHLDVPPQELISISVPLGGFLKDTEMLQGSKVKKGQVIAVIENPEYIQVQQDYLEARSQLSFASADHDRQKELAQENVNSQKTLQQAKVSFETWLAKTNALKARLQLLNVNLKTLEEGNITSRINLYAPINGYVTEVNVNIGKYVNPTDVIFEIVDTRHLHAELIIFEKDVPRIKIGQKVRFTLANESVERIATVYLIGRQISADRTIRIHCHLDKEDTQLLPGMYLKAVVEAGSTMVTALPNEAIVDFQGKKYIFIPAEEKEKPVENESADREENHHHFQLVEILTGPGELGYTEIILPENIAMETKVVVKGAYELLSKMKNSEEEGHGH
jgi:membrane fusion protein, heavy metal efflux system